MSVNHNPAELLRLGHDPALCRLLRACGAEEVCITGGASDYDQFLALASALPLCEGHPLRDEVNIALTDATGLSAPLCPHTAKAHWDSWVELYWYGGDVSLPVFPAACPDCAPTAPHVLGEGELTALPNPSEVKAESREAWSKALETAIFEAESGPNFPFLALPDDYAFVRPDPYHAELAVGKVSRGEVLTARERDLLFTQALRVWGLMPGEHPLLLRGGSPDAMKALLAYLEASKALLSAVWIPDDPADVGAISGLYSRVSTGYVHSEANARAYAAVAPLGRATVVVE